MLLAALFIPLPAALIVFPILDTIPGFGLLDADPDLDPDCPDWDLDWDLDGDLDYEPDYDLD